MNNITPEDQKKIDEYQKKLGKYARPSVTADIVAVRPALFQEDEAEWRAEPKFALEILLIKRGLWPHEGAWALPGGFVRKDETVEDGAHRELREETALVTRKLIPVGVFSKPGRDMRTWVISNAFAAVCGRGEGADVKGGDDAAVAKWLRIEFPTIGNPVAGKDPEKVLGFDIPFKDGNQPLFTLRGTYEPDELAGGRVLSVERNPLAFDHGEIIATAFLRMMAFDPRKLAFFFLPGKFTLSNYIDVYQYLTRNSVEQVNIPNFRRQLTSTRDPLLEVCEGEYAALEGRGHAPAKLFRRRI